MKKRILIVEDSLEYIQIIESSLSPFYSLLTAQTGAEAIQLLNQQSIDLALLDVVLPDMNGYQICDFIRNSNQFKDIAVIFLTGQDQLEEKISGFEHGADDYLTKPFHHKELLARINANLRKSNPTASSLIKIDDLVLDFTKQSVTINGQPTEDSLTKIEFKLLSYLSKHPNWVLSRAQILDEVWSNKLNVSDRTIDSHISNIRKKILNSSVHIESVHGSGYRLKCTASKKAA